MLDTHYMRPYIDLKALKRLIQNKWPLSVICHWYPYSVGEPQTLSKRGSYGSKENGQKGINQENNQFTLPGLIKIEVKWKPATKARKDINPLTGEETIFKAKPARNVVKIRPLKKVKDMVAWMGWIG